MKKAKIIISLFVIGFFFQQLFADIKIEGNFKQVIDSLKLDKKDSFVLNKLSIEVDIPFTIDEFCNLTELYPNQKCTADNLAKACKFLSYKKRFNEIDLLIIDCEQGKNIHFKLKAMWMIKKVDCYGILFGKQHYMSHYTQQCGDIFDVQLHEESIKEIKNLLNNEGYFNHTVADELIYSKKYKTIKIRIHLTRNKEFKINQVFCNFNKPSQEINYDLNRLAHTLKKKFCQQLLYRRYTKDRVTKQMEKIRNYLKKKSFSNARITFTKSIDKINGTISLTFSITLGKRKAISISGNRYFSTKEIQEEIIGSDEPDWLFAPDIITEQIMYAYHKKGFWNTDVLYKKSDQSEYLFIINEGSPTIIDDIQIKDDNEILQHDIKLFWPELTIDKQYDLNKLEIGIERLKNYYYSQGFWDFSIIGKRFFKNQDTNKHNIRILASRGVQRFWGGLTIESHKDLESINFFKKYTRQDPHEPIPFNYNWLAQQRFFLINHFQNEGYWYVDVQPAFKSIYLDEKKVKIFVNWEISKGECVKFGKLIFRGDSKLPFKRILKEIKFKEDELWQQEKIDLTRKKLKRLDIFKTVQITPTKLAKHATKKPIIISLIDDDPAEIRLRLGYFLTSKNFLFKRESTPKIGASLAIKNPTNNADKLLIDIDWTRFERKTNFDYQQPSFFGLPLTGKIKGYSNKYTHPVRIGSSSSAYEAIQNGFLAGINDEYKEDFFWGINIGNEWIRTSRVRGFINLDQKLIDKTLPFFFIEPSILIDKLDNRIDPQNGTLTFASLKAMIPENNGSIFARLIFEQSFFYPIIKNKIIFAGRLRLGHIFRRSFNQIMPTERFYLGGPYSVRGYEKDSIPPIGVTEKDQSGKIINEYTIKNENDFKLDKSISREYTIQGGSTMLNGNIEIRFPVFNQLGAVIFQDIGILSQTGFLGISNTWFPTSGFGIRYKTPIGAIRFDIGWKWKHRLPGDSSYAWYLTIGEAF